MTKTKCRDCNKVKELTVHGNCWKCHLGEIQISTRIKTRLDKMNEKEGVGKFYPLD